MLQLPVLFLLLCFIVLVPFSQVCCRKQEKRIVFILTAQARYLPQRKVLPFTHKPSRTTWNVSGLCLRLCQRMNCDGYREQESSNEISDFKGDQESVTPSGLKLLQQAVHTLD